MKEKIVRKGIKKRLFSVVLTLAMVFSLMPGNLQIVYAASWSEQEIDGVVYQYDTDHISETYDSEWEEYQLHCRTCGSDVAHTLLGEWELNSDYGAPRCIAAGHLRVKPHEHTFATSWSKDETHHWKAATCAHNTMKDSESTHTWNSATGKCTVCDYACLHTDETGAACGKCGKALHTHTWEYSLVSPDTIQATCNVDNHTTVNNVTLTLSATSANYSSITGLGDFNTATGKTIAESDVEFYQVITPNTTTGGVKLDSKPVDNGLSCGFYYAKLTVEGQTATKTFKIGNPVAPPEGYENWPATATHENCEHPEKEHFYYTGESYIWADDPDPRATGRNFWSYDGVDYTADYYGNEAGIWVRNLWDPLNEDAPRVGWYWTNGDGYTACVPTYTVSFDAKGGSGTETDWTGILGEFWLPTSTALIAPEETIFDGWSLTPNGDKISSESIMVTEDTTLYAVWKSVHNWSYSVTGTTVKATCDGDHDSTCSKSVTLTIKASDADYSGSPISATADKTAWEAAGLTVPVIKYVGKGTTTYEESETAPTAVGKYTAKITVDNKTASVDFEIIDPNATPDDGNVKVPEDKQEGNFEAGGIKNSTEEVKSAVLTTEDKEAIEAGKDVLVWVEIKDHTETVTKEDKTKVEEKLDKDFAVGTYLDVTLWKQITGSDANKVTDVPNGKVKIGFTIPKDLQKANRTYKIVRVHDGVAEIIDAVVDAEFGLTFETDRFSTYALIYTDADVTKPAETPAKTPGTGDTSPIALYVLMMGLAGVAMLVSKKRRAVR